MSNIYASGDVLDKAIPKLTPTATFESNYIAAHILGMTQDEIQYPAIPSVLYSLPRLSQIGVSVQELSKVNVTQLNIFRLVNKWYLNIKMKRMQKCMPY